MFTFLYTGKIFCRKEKTCSRFSIQKNLLQERKTCSRFSIQEKSLVGKKNPVYVSLYRKILSQERKMVEKGMKKRTNGYFFLSIEEKWNPRHKKVVIFFLWTLYFCIGKKLLIIVRKTGRIKRNGEKDFPIRLIFMYREIFDEKISRACHRKLPSDALQLKIRILWEIICLIVRKNWKIFQGEEKNLSIGKKW